MVARDVSELRGYQNRLATYLYENDSALVVVKVGGGKTASALTAIAELIRDGHIRHALVLAPKRVARIVWPDEIAGWSHTKDLRYAVLAGSQTQRAALLAGAHEREITIAGIDITQWLVDELRKLPKGHPVFDLMVIDEISRFRTPSSKRGKALRLLAPRWKMKWGMTGSPRPNSLLNLFAPLRLLTDGKIWGNSYEKWKRLFFYPTDFMGYNWVALPTSEDTLMADAAEWSVTLGEGDMPELPALNIVPDYVELPAVVRKVYRQMERDLFAKVDGRRNSVVAFSRATAVGKLSQIANGYLYGEGAGDVETMHDEKLAWLADLVAEMEGEPLMIVYEFVEDIRLLREAFGADLPVLGAGVSDTVAAKHVADWNARKLPLLALHPASAGHGLNLQHGGSHMAWLSPCWSTELWEQTLGRLHRPGQAASSVTAHVCMAKDTVDELKLSRVAGRLTEQEAFSNYLRERGSST